MYSLFTVVKSGSESMSSLSLTNSTMTGQREVGHEQQNKITLHGTSKTLQDEPSCKFPI